MTKLWGGRFTKKTHKLVEAFTNSIHFDQKLAEYDCVGSLCHIDVLKKARLLTAGEHARLRKGLETILKSIKDGSFAVDEGYEDIHSYIQALLEKKAGKAALKLHTCRSRNDQVAFDTKLYCLENIGITRKLLWDFNKCLFDLAEKNVGIVIPGYTHLQHAIPIGLVEYLSSYGHMILRDENRLKSAFANIELTMGAGALAGTMIERVKYQVAATTGLPKEVKAPVSSVDAVSDRDFVIETLSALAITGMHLSRLAEDMVLWASKEFDFVDIDEAFCTGSSLMPQKKNPDVLELVRGYTGRLYGNLVSVMVMMKGLPLTYNRDMQLDKEPLFDSFEIVQSELAVLSELFKKVSFKKENIKKQLDDECLYATDMADYLVRNGVPFKTAHGVIGKLIQKKLKTRTDIRRMDDDTLKKIHPLLTATALKKIMDPMTSVKSKKSVKRRK